MLRKHLASLRALYTRYADGNPDGGKPIPARPSVAPDYRPECLLLTSEFGCGVPLVAAGKANALDTRSLLSLNEWLALLSHLGLVNVGSASSQLSQVSEGWRPSCLPR